MLSKVLKRLLKYTNVTETCSFINICHYIKNIFFKLPFSLRIAFHTKRVSHIKLQACLQSPVGSTPRLRHTCQPGKVEEADQVTS